jgi:hypothetical protein
VSRRCWMVLAGLAAMAISSTSAAADGWSLSKLVPFQKSSASKRAHASVSDGDRSGGLPRMSVPNRGTKSRPPDGPSEPSTLSKLNQGTKDFFGKTKDVLMPWSKSSKKPAARPVSTTRTATKTPWYKSWIPQKKQQQKPKTVSEFIGQDRPEF